MSIKIYDGFCSDETDPFALASALRGVLEPTFYAELDQALEALGELAPADAFAVCDEIDRLDRQQTHTFNPLDLQYRVELLPKASGGTLVLVFGEKSNRYAQALLDAGLVRDYGYWNNCDEPDEVSEQEWEQRKHDWGSALSRPGARAFDSSPAEVALCFSGPARYQVFAHLNDKDRTPS